MFIYILENFKTIYKHSSFDFIDVEGNNFLHLIALNIEKSVHFIDVFYNYSPQVFIKLLNLKNNEGLTPIFLSV